MQHEMARLRERVAELEEWVRYYKDALEPKGFMLLPGGGYLTPTEAKIATRLLHSRPGLFVTEEQLNQAVYRDADRPDTEKLMQVHVYKLRGKLRPLGITITSVRGVTLGYALDPDSHAKLKALVATE